MVKDNTWHSITTPIANYHNLIKSQYCRSGNAFSLSSKWKWHPPTHQYIWMLEKYILGWITVLQKCDNSSRKGDSWLSLSLANGNSIQHELLKTATKKLCNHLCFLSSLFSHIQSVKKSCWFFLRIHPWSTTETTAISTTLV